MQNNYLKLVSSSTIIISVLLSVCVCLALRQQIVSIDLIKILNAQASYANREIYKNPHSKHWIYSMEKINDSIRQTVKHAAGRSAIVVVAPAVVQGADDITDRVLVALGLPGKLPKST